MSTSHLENGRTNVECALLSGAKLKCYLFTTVIQLLFTGKNLQKKIVVKTMSYMI